MGALSGRDKDDEGVDGRMQYGVSITSRLRSLRYGELQDL